MNVAAVLNATTKQLFRYKAHVIAKRVNLAGAFKSGCLIPTIGLLAVPAAPIVASSFGMGWAGFGVGLGWVGLGWVGLVIFASAVMHVSRVGSRRHAQFEKDLQSEIQIALGWDRWAPHGVSVTTWTE